MSIVQVKFYCTNCGTKRIYHACEEVPRRCPQCQRDSRPKYARLRNKVPFLPALVSLGLLFSLVLYDLFVIRTSEDPWLPYVVVSVLFGGAWIPATLLLDWPKLPKGPHIVSEIKWSRQDADPQELLGLRVAVTLEGRYPRKSFVSTIEGHRPILMDLGVDDAEENDRIYVLRSEQNPLEATRILFHPHWVQFKRGALKKLRKECRGAFSYGPSMEELLLNQRTSFKGIYGIIYKTQNPDTLARPQIPWSLLSVMTSSYGEVAPLSKT